MGRRSINTTKSGKYMNPTDQARKEARKKELKKNKKQRQMVRAAVLKGKDPQQLILDLEKIDQMEYNVLQPSPLNEKVLKDKRKKLRDTLERVLKMYNKDDPDKWAELKRLQVEYERKRSALFNYYESVKNAQQVQVDDIPLPIASLPAELQAVFVGMPSQIPLPARAPQLPILRPHPTPPPFLQQPQHSILKKTSAYKIPDKVKEPPGIPPGPPPDLTDDEEDEAVVVNRENIMPVEQQPSRQKTIRFADDEDAEHDDLEEEKQPASPIRDDSLEQKKDLEVDDKPRPTSLQQRMLAMAGQDIDQFMKEMEEVHKKRKADRAADLENRLAAIDHKIQVNKPILEREDSPPPGTMPGPVPVNMQTEPMTGPPRPGMQLPPGIPPPLLFRPPPPRGVPALMGIRLPPGPPPGLPPRLGMRLPPGPPPGMPPRMIRPPGMPVVPPPANVLSAAPQLISRPQEKTGATIQADAQIRNLSADVTRFLPTALRVKRDSKQPKKDVKGPQLPEPKVEIQPQAPVQVQTKDDAYQQFMKEMEGLL